MEIEGYLLKWTNYLSGWKERYFSLQSGVLYYSSRKNSPVKGQIHLKVSKISATTHDSLGILIDSGTKIIHLKAQQLSEKLKWLNALKNSQREIQELDESFAKIKNSSVNASLLEEFLQKTEVIRGPEPRKYEFVDVVERKFKEMLDLQRSLDESLQKLVGKFDFLKENQGFSLVESVVDACAALINAAGVCYEAFEKERKNIEKTLRKLEKLEKLDEKTRDFAKTSGFLSNSLEIFSQENISLPIEYHSQIGGENSLTKPPSLLQQTAKAFHENYQAFLAKLKAQSPAKYALFTENPAFKARLLPLPSQEPAICATKFAEDFLINASIKSFFGKTFAELPFPMQVHEPLTLLQKTCEIFLFSQLLRLANVSENPALRLAYVTAFVCAFYCVTEGCRSKPFHGFLGETFEFRDESRGNLRFFAEQVKENVIAVSCCNEDFEFSSAIVLKMTFWGSKLEILPQGTSALRLRGRNEAFSFDRPVTCVENLLTSSFFVDNYGEIRVENAEAGLFCDVSFKRRGFDGRNAGEIHGIFSTGNCEIRGKWTEKLVFVRESRENKGKFEEITLWSNEVREEQAKNPYNFTNFAMRLNRLDQKSVFELPLTDSRFRSDVKALEYGLLEIAREEHERLRERNREKLKKTEEIEEIALSFFEKREDSGNGGGIAYVFKEKL